MNKYLSLILAAFPLLALAQDPNSSVMNTASKTEDEARHINHKKSHWVVNYGFETMRYPTPYSFVGNKNTFKPSNQNIWGGRLSFGREFYLGKGFFTTSKIEGYYMGTLFEESKTAGKEDTQTDADIKFSSKKHTGQIFGGDAVQTFGYQFHMKTKNPIMKEWSYLTIEPFIEIGYGLARGYNKLNYFYQAGPNDEYYKHEYRDELINQKIGAGVNFTSNTGYFLFLRATQNDYTITKRMTDIASRVGGVTNPSIHTTGSAEYDKPIMIYALGGGYKF